LSFEPSSQYEIICVDNASSDGIDAEIAKNFPEVQFIGAQRNCGFAKASNLGIVNSHGEYILLLNSDTKIIEPIFDGLIEYMDSHPETGAVGPRHLWEDGRFQVSYGKFPTLFTEISRKFIQHRILSEKEVNWLSASCLLLRRKALQDAGLLDEALFMYFEDIDLCARIRDKGWRIRYFPKAAITHYHGRSVEANALTGFFEYRRSQLYFAKKYYGTIGGISMRMFLFLRFLIIGFRSVLEFCLGKIFKKNTQNAYARMILSGKVIAMVFLSKAVQPIEPILNV
jgi:GT2 family glycosyltransferase